MVGPTDVQVARHGGSVIIDALKLGTGWVRHELPQTDPWTGTALRPTYYWCVPQPRLQVAASLRWLRPAVAVFACCSCTPMPMSKPAPCSPQGAGRVWCAFMCVCCCRDSYCSYKPHILCVCVCGGGGGIVWVNSIHVAQHPSPTHSLFVISAMRPHARFLASAPLLFYAVLCLCRRTNGDTGQSVWEADLLTSCSMKLRDDEVVDSGSDEEDKQALGDEDEDEDDMDSGGSR
jgi:hypothetical protein